MTDRTTGQVLQPEFLLDAYSHGFFPMADPKTGEISWFSPDPRAIVPLETFKPSRSLQRRVRSAMFSIRINTAFEQVIRACADRPETWISEEIINAYTSLHKQSYVHCFETWKDNRLVGGLYGVAINGAFFGESMFALVPDASKVAFVHLVHHLNDRGFLLLDSQIINPHMSSLGAVEIPRSEYLALLHRALKSPATFLPGAITPVNTRRVHKSK